MKLSIRILFLKIAFTFCLSQNLAQDVEFSQFYTSKNYLNPAFTGLSSDQSFSSVYRNQWPSIKNAYESYFVSFDRRIKGREAAVGIYYLGDVAGEGALQTWTMWDCSTITKSSTIVPSLRRA